MKKETFFRLAKYMRPYRRHLIMALIFSLGGVICALFSPIIIGKAIDKMLGPNQVQYDAVLRLVFIFLAISGLGFIFQWAMGIFAGKVSAKAMKDLREESFAKMLKAPFYFIDGHSHGDLVNRIINDVDYIADGVLQGITQLFNGLMTILGTLLFMLSINGLITVLVVFVTPISIIFATYISKRTFGMAAKQTRIQGEITGFLSEILTQQKTVQAFSYEKRAIDSFANLNEELKKWGFKAQLYPAFTNPITRFINGLIYVGVGVSGAHIALRGLITIGQLSSFLSYAHQYTKPFNEVSGIIGQLQMAISAAQRVFQLLDLPQEPKDDEKALSLDRAKGDINFDNIEFSYSKDKEFIKDLSLQVRAGQRVAIVGTTGSGKTTLINLLMRFYELERGSILLDNKNYKQITMDSLRKQFGMVLQDTWLKSGTVFENIAYGNPQASLEAVIEVAKKAHAHDFIEKLEKGYDTPLIENGGNLSKGQRQLLCIARVMLISPPVLLLDEATSSIDTRTELSVQRAFLDMMQGRTSFVVAHRLSTIINSDLILVMDDGKIVEKGTHDELIAQKATYKNLYLKQYEKDSEPVN